MQRRYPASRNRKDRIIVALAGNPNSGKTTLFNALTGARQHVGNYPGVTVEKKTGTSSFQGIRIEWVDLPGTYSLTPYSVEEAVARRFVLEEKPDVVVDILDASNLERNLYLAVQFLELGVPLVFALNMSDVAVSQGIRIDVEKLAGRFGVPVVPTVGPKGRGMKELVKAVVAVACSPNGRPKSSVYYGPDVDRELERLQKAVEPLAERDGLDPGWVALKLLEEDPEVMERCGSGPVRSVLEESTERIRSKVGVAPEVYLSERRYAFIEEVCSESIRKSEETRTTASDLLDRVLLNRFLGIPILLALMYLVFQLTFTLGAAPASWIEEAFQWLGETISGVWPPGSESVLRSLLVDGVLGGVGNVIVFLPNILFLFLAIALLEDSGYMARAAFVMDRLMQRMGLHGKSFIPMLIGFGCSVPAIMATRTLENRRDRIVTILVIPLMSCGARFPIYTLIIPAFFPPFWRGPVLWSIYVIGILLAIAAARFLRRLWMREESEPFILEVPPYRIPNVRSVAMVMWERSWMYLKKAGTLILTASVILWALSSFPKNPHLRQEGEDLLHKAAASYRASLEDLARRTGLSVAALDTGDGESGLDRGAALQEAGGRAGGGESALRSRYLRMVRAVEAERARFARQEETAARREGTPPYDSPAAGRDARLNRLQQSDPEMFDAAVQYLNAADSYRAAVEDVRRKLQAEALTYSLAGRIGRILEPVLKPLGFDWKIGTALIGAVAAKEVFVAQMGIVYSLGEAGEGSEALQQHLKARYTPLTAFCIMLFCLIGMPCMATVAVTVRETGSWKWGVLQLGGLTGLAYLVTLLVFQGGRLLGIGMG